MSDNLTKGFQSLLSAKIFTSVFGTLTLPLVVRVLGPESYGDYAFLLSTYSLAMIFVSSGVTEGVQKFVAERRSQANWRETVVGFYFRLAVVLAAVGSMVVVVVTHGGLVGRQLGPQFDLLFYLFAAYVFTGQLKSFTRRTLMGLELEQFSESLAIVRKVVAISVGLALAVVGLDVAGFMLGHIAATLLFTGLGVFAIRRELSPVSILRARTGDAPIGELLSFNTLNVVAVLLMTSLYHIDVLMIRLLVGGEQTGFYKAALMLAEYIWLVPIVLQTLMIHSASSLWSQGKFERVQALASRLTRHVFLVTALLALGIFALADRFIPLYFGAEFEPAVRPLLVLLPGAVGFALARPLYGINKATGRLPPLIAALVFAAAFNVAANYFLIPVYGITGAAVATSVSYGSMFFLQVLCALYIGYSPLRSLRPLPVLGTVALAGACIVGFERLLDSTVLALVVVPAFGFVVFTTLSVLTGAVDAAELRTALSALPSPVERRVQSLVFGE